MYLRNFGYPCKRTVNTTRFIFNIRNDIVNLKSIYELYDSQSIFTQDKPVTQAYKPSSFQIQYINIFLNLCHTVQKVSLNYYLKNILSTLNEYF